MIDKLKKEFIGLIRPYIKGTFEYLKRNKDLVLKEYVNKPILKDVIVSMTTYEPRVRFFEYSILSIIAGSVLPENIYVYVPKGFKTLLQKSDSFLTEVYENGLVTIVEMEEDYYCHSKYYYSFRDFGNQKNIVLCDDDVVYYEKWLEQLYNYSVDFSDFDVFAYMAIDVPIVDRKILTYDKWIRCSHKNLPSGTQLYTEAVGGVFYKKGLFKKEVLNSEKFLQLCSKADDVWLWFCVCLNKGKVCFVPTYNNKKLQYIIPSSQEVALWKENTFGKRNDLYVLQCKDYFKQSFKMDIVNHLNNAIYDRKSK